MTLTRTQIEALVMRVQNDFLATPALKLPLGKASQRSVSISRAAGRFWMLLSMPEC